MLTVIVLTFMLLFVIFTLKELHACFWPTLVLQPGIPPRVKVAGFSRNINYKHLPWQAMTPTL